MRSARIDLILAAAFCGAVGLYDVLYVVLLLSGGPLIGPFQDVLFPDFLVFHGAARAWLEGKLALIYDIDAFTHLQNAFYRAEFGREVEFRPFFYPPIWLLMLLPFAWLGVAKAYAAFMAATLAVATTLVGRRDLWGWLAVVTSPAAVWVALSGQNTFLSVALFYSGIALLERAPMAAGISLGLLAYKPQIWALVPLALLAARQWQALGWMVCTIVGLSLASLGLFGLDFWLAFFRAAQEASSLSVSEHLYQQMFMQMTTPMAAMRMLGFSPGLAGAVQFAVAALAACVVWIAFRRHGPSDARTAVLATATFLVSPYTLNYDLLLLMPAVVTLFRLGAARGFYPGERLVHLATWLMPTFGMMSNRGGWPLMPLAILLFGWIAWARLQAAAKVELPEAAGAR